MKGKKGSILFVVICLFICILPFAGMTVARTDTTTENTELKEFPAIRDDRGWNVGYLKDLGGYFEDHFAFREALVTADSMIQSKVFQVSNMDTVIAGENGWLYYTDTLDDYQGRNVLSDRGIWNAAHNISLIKDYVEGQGADFLLAVPPNKNSLYGKDMPYYYENKTGAEGNLKRLPKALKKADVSYCNLYSVFKEQEEVLYLKRDSHWNGKGALLAYNEMMDGLDYLHETYETTSAKRTRTEYGDLNKMIYPLAGEPEWNYDYEFEKSFEYVTETESVEDAWIETSGSDKKGSLLMFRDSFGNTLLPYFAEAFGKAYFSKGEPYAVEAYMEKYKPSAVIVEKVERNISDFAENPPIMTGPLIKNVPEAESSETKTEFEMVSAEANTDYWEIRGLLDEKYASGESPVYVRVETEGNASVYEAFTVSDGAADNGFLLYLPKDELAADKVKVGVMTEADGQWITAAEKEITLAEEE